MQPVTPQDILTFNKKTKKWFHGDRELTKAEVDNLKSEADIIAKTSLWKHLINGGKYYAQVRAITEATTEMELKQVQEFHKVVRMFETFISDLNSTRE